MAEEHRLFGGVLKNLEKLEQDVFFMSYSPSRSTVWTPVGPRYAMRDWKDFRKGRFSL